MIIRKLKSGSGYIITTDSCDMYIIKRYQLVWIVEQFDEINREFSLVFHTDTLGAALELLFKGDFSND